MRRRSAFVAICTVSAAIVLSPPVFAGAADVSAEVTSQSYPRVVVSGLARPTGIVAVDSETLLVAVAGSPAGTDARGAVVRIDLATGGLTVLELGGSSPLRVAVDGEGRPLWSSPSEGTVWRRHADGAARALVSDAIGVSGLALDARGRVYFTSAPLRSSGGQVSQISMLEGGLVTVLRASEPEPTDIAAGADGDLYWTNASAGAIVHQSPAGVLDVVASGLDRPYGLALDEARGVLYFTEVPTPGMAHDAGGRNAVSALDLRSGAISVIGRGDAEPSDVAVTPGGRVFWVSAASGTVVEASDGNEDEKDGTFRARLSGSEEVPVVESLASGDAKFELRRADAEDDDGGAMSLRASAAGKKIRFRLPKEPKPPKGEASLDYELKVRRISGVTMAHLHFGPIGTNGPVVVTLFSLATPGGNDAKIDHHGYVTKDKLVGPLAGNWEGFIAALAAGQIYVNIHTVTNQGGEIRGQLVPPGGEPANHPPNGTIITPPGDIAVQVDAPVNFAGEASDPDGDMVEVKWNFGDGGKSEDLVPAPHAYREPGEFTVTFTAEDSKGLVDPTPDRRKVTVSTGPAPTPTPTPTATAPLATPTPTNTPVAPPSATPTPTNTPVIPPPPTPTPTNTPVTPPPTATPPPTPTNTPVLATPTPTNTPVPPTPTNTPVPPTPTPTNTPVPPTPTPTNTPVPPTPTPTPTASAVTLSFLQTSVFTPKCTGCHGGSSPEAGMNLSAGLSYSNLVNVAATTSSSPMLRVKPLDPANSYLAVFLASGHRSSSVTTTDRANIDAWILAGANNN